MKHSQEEYWRPRFHAPPLRPHPDPPPTIQCSWYPYEGQCPYMRLALICWRSNGECTFTDTFYCPRAEYRLSFAQPHQVPAFQASGGLLVQKKSLCKTTVGRFPCRK